MDKIFSMIRHWLSRLSATDRPLDPTETMCPRDLADLPVHHPRHDQDCFG